ncbi:helix-turn-helix domain-containing protein [Microbacterium sp. AGC85]
MDDGNVMDLRTRRRIQLRREVSKHAMDLYAERGYEETTVDDIAHALGISQRTFFRHYRTKEETVLFESESLAQALAEADFARMSLTDALAAIQEIYREMAVRLDSSDDERSRRAQRLIAANPTLRQAASARHYTIMEDTRRRLAQTLGDGLTARLVVELSTATPHAALDEWAAQPHPATTPAVEFYDRAMHSLAELRPVPRR